MIIRRAIDYTPEPNREIEITVLLHDDSEIDPSSAIVMMKSYSKCWLYSSYFQAGNQRHLFVPYENYEDLKILGLEVRDNNIGDYTSAFCVYASLGIDLEEYRDKDSYREVTKKCDLGVILYGYNPPSGRGGVSVTSLSYNIGQENFVEFEGEWYKLHFALCLNQAHDIQMMAEATTSYHLSFFEEIIHEYSNVESSIKLHDYQFKMMKKHFKFGDFNEKMTNEEKWQIYQNYQDEYEKNIPNFKFYTGIDVINGYKSNSPIAKNQSEKSKEVKGWIYFIEAVGLKRIKIGFSKDVKKRMVSMKTN